MTRLLKRSEKPFDWFRTSGITTPLHSLMTLQPLDQDHSISDGIVYKNVCSMCVFRKQNSYGILSQLDHEFFHAWNPLRVGYLSAIE